MTTADPNEYRLVRDLMKGYDKRIRPSLNHSDSLNVTFGLALAQIIDVVSQVVFMYDSATINVSNCRLLQAELL